MKYLYTTEPDEGCHKINGVYGRPVHTYEQKALKAKGWKDTVDELREEGREEKVEVTSSIARATASEPVEIGMYTEREHAAKKYEAKFGKKPHHKAKLETIIAKVESDD